MQVAAHDHDAIPDAAIDIEAAADDNGGIGHLFVALDADVLTEGDACAGQAVSSGVRRLCGGRRVNEQTDRRDRQERLAHWHLTFSYGTKVGAILFPRIGPEARRPSASRRSP